MKILQTTCLVAVALSASACFLRPYTADLSDQTVTPPTLMTASPSPRTLYVVMDPTKVADEFQIQNLRHSVKGFRGFLGSTLHNAMRPYFADVRVVTAAPPTGGADVAVADVRLDSVEARNIPMGGMTYSVLRMQWAFAVRPGEASDYLFSYAGAGNSDIAYQTLDEGCDQLLVDTVGNLMAAWTEEGVSTALRRLDEPAGAAPVAAPAL